jgi:hypothetical protein
MGSTRLIEYVEFCCTLFLELYTMRKEAFGFTVNSHSQYLGTGHALETVKQFGEWRTVSWYRYRTCACTYHRQTWYRYIRCHVLLPDSDLTKRSSDSRTASVRINSKPRRQTSHSSIKALLSAVIAQSRQLPVASYTICQKSDYLWNP